MVVSRLWMGVLVALTMLSGTARAQDVASPEPKAIALGWATPFATLGVHGAFGTPNEVFGLYVYWTKLRDEGGEKGFAVRRDSRSETSESEIEWATSFGCPGLEDVLIDLESIQMPKVDVPTVGRDDGQGPVADGVTYTLWSRWPTWPDGFGYSVELSSNVGTPLAEWSTRFRQILDDCWSDMMPEAAGRTE
jgi:hypothetical protein